MMHHSAALHSADDTFKCVRYVSISSGNGARVDKQADMVYTVRVQMKEVQ